MDFNTLKALHIIFVVSWFAGLFYIVRLFIYHTEAQEKSDIEKEILSNQFEILEKKLWWIITTPAMVLTILFGTLMFLDEGHDYLIHQKWMHIKLTFVALLLTYHFVCQRIMKQMQQGKFNWNSTQLRIWNEVATLALVAIVFLVELQNALNWIKATLGFFGVAIGLMIAIKTYKKLRTKNKL